MDFAGTTSANSIGVSSTQPESGKGESQPSKSGSETTRGRRTARVTKVSDSTPLEPSPLVAAQAQAERWLSGDEGRKELYAQIKKDLLVNYVLETRAGQDTKTNPQHSRASRKQAKEIAELLIQLDKVDK